MSDEQTQIFSMRLPIKIKERLEVFSEQTNRTKTSVVLESLVEYLDRYEGLLTKLLEVKQQIKENKLASQEEVETWITSLGETKTTRFEGLKPN